MLTNDLHHLVWLGVGMDESGRPLQGSVGWIFFGYSLLLLVVNIILFVGLFIRSPQHRWPVALRVLGQIAGRVMFALDMVTPPSIGRPDPFALMIVMLFGVYAIALFGFRIFDPLPAARQTVIEQMRDGMAVFDARWQVLSLNPMAESLLHTSAAHARGTTWQELLPTFPGADQCLESGANPIEISVTRGAKSQDYALELSPLKDHRGLIVGYLLLLRDVTEQRRAHAQILAQQWAQATLQEREQLAQELHDGLSQSLAFLNVQAQAAQLCLEAKQSEAAQASLARLAEVSRELQGDMRELIGNLLTISLPSEGLGNMLRRAVTRFEEQTGLHASLEFGGDLDAIADPDALSPATGVQLLRITQEALANVRKHAGSPSQIAVRLGAQGGQLELTIADNGAGFDPALSGAEGKHFGLQVMSQRAERIGGHMAVHAAPGQGTRVEVCVPLATGGTGKAI